MVITCRHCNAAAFSTEVQLEHHVQNMCKDAKREHVSDEAAKTCKYCNAKCANGNQLKIHQRRHCEGAKLEKLKKQLVCEYCGRTCSNEFQLKFHKSSDCDQAKQYRLDMMYKCPHCAATRKTKNEMDYHIRHLCEEAAALRERKRLENQVTCSCSAKFDNMKKMGEHKKLDCPDVIQQAKYRMRNCKNCGQACKNEYQKRLHEKLSCEVVKRTCKRCKVVFSDVLELLQHNCPTQLHVTPGYSECKCGKYLYLNSQGFVDKDKLVRHSSTCTAFGQLSRDALKYGYISPDLWKREHENRFAVLALTSKNDTEMYPVLKNKFEAWRIYTQKVPLYDENSAAYQEAFDADVEEFKQPPYLLYFPRVENVVRCRRIQELLFRVVEGINPLSSADLQFEYGRLDKVIADSVRFKSSFDIRKRLSDINTDVTRDDDDAFSFVVSEPGWYHFLKDSKAIFKDYLASLASLADVHSTTPRDVSSNSKASETSETSEASLSRKRKLEVDDDDGGSSPKKSYKKRKLDAGSDSENVECSWRHLRPNSDESRKYFCKMLDCNPDNVDKWISKVFD